MFQKLNYGFFKSPTKKELIDLYKNVYKTLKYFQGKTNIRMFPYISPELFFGGEGHYLVELDFANRYNINKKNYKEKLEYLFDRMDINYLEYNCPNKKCDWHKWCKRIKWVWLKNVGKSKKEGKLKSYCEMKKAINSAYYDALVKK